MDKKSLKIYGKVSKKHSPSVRPEKLTLSGNFTEQHKEFSVTPSSRRDSMRQGILDIVMRKTEEAMGQEKDEAFYEDPKDVIASERSGKPARKRNIQGITVASSGQSKEGKSHLKEQKKKLNKKYEIILTSLMDKCEENVIMLSEKDTLITKLKDKLRSVLEYNKLFAEENDQLKSQHDTLVKYVEECKAVIKQEKGKNIELEGRNKVLEEKVKKFEIPDRDNPPMVSTAIPLVEVCMSCSSRQIILNQARDQNSRLQNDMQALKDVLYRLNVQLSRYQDKLRSNVPPLTADGKGEGVYKAKEHYDGFDSLINASLGYRETGSGAGNTEEVSSQKAEEHSGQGRVVDLSGLLSAQALAPLFDAYQENLQEKDSLIHDYEKQFETINKKSKEIVSENKILTDKVKILEEELTQARQSYKKSLVERETVGIEKSTLMERAERAESKLKEVYELYEDKMAAMMRDYEVVHREYFAVKNALEVAEGKLAQVEALRARTVPADMHERRLEHCKRLLEELKHQYSMETERRTEQMTKLQEQLKVAEEKYSKTNQEHKTAQEELEAALKNVRLYRKAAVIFRQRLKAATARMSRVRTSVRRARSSNEPLKQALQALEKIKSEIKVVKSRAYTSLEELERRIVEQERRAAHAHSEYRRELERATLALEHKEAIIRSLIDKVADVEEVRLSQTNTHRLQGIVSDSSPDRTSPNLERRGSKSGVKVLPGPGGYFQQKNEKKKGKE